MSDTESSEKANKRSARTFDVIFVFGLFFIACYLANLYYYDQLYLEGFSLWTLYDNVTFLICIVLVIIALYYVLRRTHHERISGLLCLISAAIMVHDFYSYLTWGDFFKFVEAFLILVVGVLQIAFSIHLFRGLRESAVLLKVIIPASIVLFLLIAIVEFIQYNEYYTGLNDYMKNFYFVSNGLQIVAFASLYDKDVLKDYKLKSIKLPRIMILAGVMLLYGAIYFFDIQPIFSESKTAFSMFSNILFMVVGLLFLLYRDVDVLSATSILLFVIGVATVITELPNLLSIDTLTLVIAIVTCFAGIACIVLCALMYSGDKYNTKRLQVIMLVLLAVYVVPIIFDARIHFEDVYYLVENDSDRFLSAMLVGATFIALTDKSIQYTNVKARMSYNVKTMNMSVCNDSEAFIPRTELYKLYRKTGWTYTDGPVEREKTVTVFVNKSEYAYTLRKWKDSGKLTGEVHTNNNGTYIQAMRFDIKKVIMDGTIEDCSKVTVYGEHGFFIEIPVSDLEEDIEVKAPLKIFYKIVGHKNKKTVHIKFDEEAAD